MCEWWWGKGNIISLYIQVTWLPRVTSYIYYKTQGVTFISRRHYYFRFIYTNSVKMYRGKLLSKNQVVILHR